MNGRRSVWSNPQVIELSKQFVPVTDEVWRLQQGRDPDEKFFSKMAASGHYANHRTKQGIYVFSPSGKFLASINSNSPDRVLRMMHEGLNKWNQLDKSQRHLPPDSDIAPEHRWEDSYPENGLDLHMIARDLPTDCDPDAPCEVKWNQDRIWFSQAEAQSWIPDKHLVGESRQVPQPLVQRLARFHLIDTVRGQTSHFSNDDVDGSKISTRITKIDEEKIHVQIQGSCQSNAAKSRRRDMPHGIKTDILGSAVFDTRAKRFVQFEMLALGTRWGRTVFNGRSNHLEESPVGFVIQIAAKDAPRIAPAFLFAYGAGWVEYPSR